MRLTFGYESVTSYFLSLEPFCELFLGSLHSFKVLDSVDKYKQFEIDIFKGLKYNNVSESGHFLTAVITASYLM